MSRSDFTPKLDWADQPSHATAITSTQLLRLEHGIDGSAAVADVGTPGTTTGDALGAAFARRTWLDVQSYGVVGNGSTDDTAALNTALAASASTGLELRGRPNHVYLVSRAGTKSFINPAGATITGKGFCLQVPSGARVDFRGAKIQHVAGGIDNVVLCNTTTTGTGDVVQVRNVVVDGGGRTDVVRTVPMVWFHGCDQSEFEGIHVQNCSYNAGQVSACTRSRFDRLVASAIIGQGWLLGGNTAYRIFDCEFGTLTAWDTADYGTFSAPGNGFCVGGQRLKIQRLIARNCAGGHKYQPGCLDVHTDYAEFDGSVLYGESSNGTANSGIKIQGDPPVSTGTATADGTTGLTSVTGTGWTVGHYIYGEQIPYGTTITAVGAGTLTLSTAIPAGTGLSVQGVGSPPPDRVSITKAVSRNCTGIGLYLHYFTTARIGNYQGHMNGRDGASAELDASDFRALEIDSFRSNLAGASAVSFSTAFTRYSFGSCVVRNCGDVTTSNINGFVPGTGEGHVGYLEIMDTRSTPVPLAQGIAHASTGVFTVGRFRCYNIAAPIRLQDARDFIGEPIIGSGTDALRGVVTLAAAATTTTIGNSNIRSATYNSGWVEPLVELTPMNASAQALGLPRYSVPASFSLKLWHSAAAGTEVFAYRVVGYQWRTTQLA